ncbi:hypothetical protein Tco_1052505, partial [Tanacetum coccineum]
TDIKEMDKNKGKADKTEHENGKSVKEKPSQSQKSTVKVNPGARDWKEHEKTSPTVPSSFIGPA